MFVCELEEENEGDSKARENLYILQGLSKEIYILYTRIYTHTPTHIQPQHMQPLLIKQAPVCLPRHSGFFSLRQQLLI